MNVKMSSSPVVERALDSAMDFLSETEADIAGGRASEEEDDDEVDFIELYEDSPDFEINYELISQLQEKQALAAANAPPSATKINQQNIDSSIKKWRKHDKDVGSAEVQVAIAHERIKYLTKHLLANKHDVAAKRGLNALVNTRRRFLNYLYNTDIDKAKLMIAELGIRFRPPGRLWDKEAKYLAFKNTRQQRVFKKKDETASV